MSYRDILIEAFEKHIEFDSRDDLFKVLKSKICEELDVLEAENKILTNNDGTLTWIYAKGNEKLLKLWKEAVPL